MNTVTCPCIIYIKIPIVLIIGMEGEAQQSLFAPKDYLVCYVKKIHWVYIPC